MADQRIALVLGDFMGRARSILAEAFTSANLCLHAFSEANNPANQKPNLRPLLSQLPRFVSVSQARLRREGGLVSRPGGIDGAEHFDSSGYDFANGSVPATPSIE